MRHRPEFPFTLCRRLSGNFYPLASCQSTDVTLFCHSVLYRTRGNRSRWLKQEKTVVGAGGRRRAKPERAGRNGTNHCGIPQWTARRHFGPGEVETEHLSPLKGGAVI